MSKYASGFPVTQSPVSSKTAIFPSKKTKTGAFCGIAAKAARKSPVVTVFRRPSADAPVGVASLFLFATFIVNGFCKNVNSILQLFSKKY